MKKLILSIALFNCLAILSHTVNNYSFTVCTANYSALTGTTNVGGQTAADDEDLSKTVTLQFSFTFSGANRTDLQVSSSGVVSYVKGSWWCGNIRSARNRSIAINILTNPALTAILTLKNDHHENNC